MSTSTNLPETRLFTSLDPYHRDVDNRPLQDLDDRDTRLAEAVDSEVSAKNVLALAVGLLTSGVLQSNKVVGTQGLVVTPLTLHVGGCLLTQQVWDAGTSTSVPALGVDAKSHDFPFTAPAATFQRPFTLAAQVVPLSGTDVPWFDGTLADTAGFSKVGKIDWALITGADEPEGTSPTWPSPLSGWVPVFHVLTTSTTTTLVNGTNVFPVGFRQHGDFQRLLPWADSPGKMLMLGTNTGVQELVEGVFGNGPDGPFPLVWDWPVPPPTGPNYVLTSTGNGAGEYQWQPAASLGDTIPIGAVLGFSQGNVQPGWLECDGSVLLRSAYPDLFTAIGTTYNQPSDTNPLQFRLPDYRGEFLRGWDHGRGVDPGRNLGTWQGWGVGPHNHYLAPGGNAVTLQVARTDGTDVSFMEQAEGGSSTDDVTSTQNNTGFTENRPRNVSIMYCVKASYVGSAAAVSEIFDSTPAGAVVDFAMPFAPQGWLVCDGSTIPRSAYPDLFAAIGTTYNQLSDTDILLFRLPDYRGEFRRGWDAGRGADTGRAFGSWQDMGVQYHKHETPIPTYSGPSELWGADVGDGPWGKGGTFVPYWAYTTGDVTHGNTTSGGKYTNPQPVSTGQGDTRPRNVAVLTCIKAYGETAPSAIGNGASNCFLYYDSSIDCLALNIRQPGLFVDGTYRMVPTPTLSTTALADDTFWHVYGYWTGTTLVMEASASGYAPDPYGGDFFYKIGNPAKTLLGIFYKKAGTVCFTRSAFVDQDQYASINPSSGSYPQDVTPYSTANLATDFQWESVVDSANVDNPPAPAEIPNYELVVLLFAYEKARIGVNLHLKYHLNGTVVGGDHPSPYAKVRVLDVSPSGGSTHRDFMVNDSATSAPSLNDYWKGTLRDTFILGSPAGQATVRKVRIRASRLFLKPGDDLSYIVAKDLYKVWNDTGTSFAFESVDTLITLEKESPVFSGLRILGFKQVPKHLW